MQRTGRQPKVHVPNSVYHVMMRGNNRQNIFYGEAYYHYFLKLFSDSAKKFDHKVLAYCLMTNRVHLMLHIKESPLSAIMQNVNFRYARWTNHHRKRVGHLFQARYAAIEVSNESYLIHLCRYIHLNPVKAKMVKDPACYQWSSHLFYKLSLAPPWMDLTKVVQSIKQKTGLNYSELISSDINRENWKPALYLSKEGKLIFDDSIASTLNEASSVIKSRKNVLPPEEVMSIVGNGLGVSLSQQLCGPSRNRLLSKKRRLLFIIC